MLPIGVIMGGQDALAVIEDAAGVPVELKDGPYLIDSGLQAPIPVRMVEGPYLMADGLQAPVLVRGLSNDPVSGMPWDNSTTWDSNTRWS